MARGHFWRVREDNIAPKQLENWPRVVAVVPARNEAPTISQAVSSLAKQDYPGDFSIIVVDHHSADATAALARKASEEFGAAQRIAIHSAGHLPPAWPGKLCAP